MRFLVFPAVVVIACLAGCSDTGEDAATNIEVEPAEITQVAQRPALTCPSGISADGLAQMQMTGFIENRINRRGLKDHLLTNQNDWGYRLVENEGRCMLNINGQTFYEGSRYTFSEYCDYELEEKPDGGQKIGRMECEYL